MIFCLLTESFLQYFLFMSIYIVNTENLSCQRPQGQLVLADGDVIEVHLLNILFYAYLSIYTNTLVILYGLTY